MKRLRLPILVLLIALPVVASTAQAALITIDFRVSNFLPSGAPADPVFGSISYLSSSSRGVIGEITSIDLTIAGHAYSIGELVTFSSTVVYPARDIEAAVGGLHSLSPGTWDFELWMHAREVPLCPPNENFCYPIEDLTPEHFAYATPGSTNTYSSNQFDYFRVTETAVPEPSTMLLLGSGLAGLLGFTKKLYRGSDL